MLRNISIRTRTWLGAGLGIPLLIAIGYIGASRVSRLDASFREVVTSIDLLDTVNHLGLELEHLVMPANDYLILGAAENEKDNFDRSAAELQGLFDRAESGVNNPGEEQFLRLAEDGYLQARRIAFKIFAIPRDEARGSARAGKLMEEMDAVVAEAVHATKDVHDIAHGEVERQAQLFRVTQQEIVGVTLVLTAFLVAFALALAILLLHWVVRPVVDLKDVAERIAAGDLSVRARVSSDDEIGILARSFNRMTDGLLELARLKDEFIFFATHELRTPATVIKGYLEMILSEGNRLVPEVRESLHQIEEADKRLLTLVNDLLEVARTEAGKMAIATSPIDMAEIVVSSIKELELLASQKGIALIYDKLTGMPKVLGDAERVKEVLINLIGNAIKYNRLKGSVTVRHELKDGFLETHVSDTGIGLSREDMKHVFEKFWRAENEATRRISGTGLGLFITKQLVEKMNGSISVASTEGQGSTFSFQLPVASSDRTLL